KFFAVSALVEEVAEFEAAGIGAVEDLRSFAVEAAHFAEEFVRACAKDVAFLREVAAQTAARVFVAGFAATDRERHIRIGARNSQFPKKLDEIGIRAVVVNDEAGIHG